MSYGEKQPFHMSKISTTQLCRFCVFVGPLLIPLIAPGLAAAVEETPAPLQIRIDIDVELAEVGDKPLRRGD